MLPMPQRAPIRRPSTLVEQPAMRQLRTARVVLRGWRDDDREAFAALNADPEVMRHFPAPLSREASDALVDRQVALLADRGWGLWAAEVPGVAPFVGFVGLSEQTFEAPFTPAVEVGWRLARAHWGRGYAPEAAAAVLDLAFGAADAGGLALDEVVSMTAVGNANSRRVMEKLGLTHDPADDFDHPNLAPGSPLRRHVLYRVTAGRWRARRPSPSAARQSPSNTT